MGKGNARDQIPAPVVTPPADIDARGRQGLLQPSATRHVCNLDCYAQVCEAGGIAAPASKETQPPVSNEFVAKGSEPFSWLPPATGPETARQHALAAAELCKGNMQPSTRVQAIRLLKLALVNLDAG